VLVPGPISEGWVAVWGLVAENLGKFMGVIQAGELRRVEVAGRELAHF